MKTSIRQFLLLVFILSSLAKGRAQQQTPYILNGSAVQNSCNCYTLTPDDTFRVGSIWNKNKINLNASFNYIFSVFLGCKDGNGADGLVFVLQPIGTSIGTFGQGLGFENVTPSIGIPIDTWQNFDYNDPFYDHTGIYKNGDLVNGSRNTLAGPVTAILNQNNIEDCQWHTMRIIWDANAKILSEEIDGEPRVQTHTDLVNDIFFGDPEVFWGFSAATGGKSNVQKVCTTLNPDCSIPADLNTCAPVTIPFTDRSKSFGTIINWWWDFGDGTKFNGQSPPPHAYPSPGYFTLKLNIEGNNGCISDTLYKKVTVGSIPKTGFLSSPKIICANYPVSLYDDSHVQYGTINQWDWNFNNGAEILSTADSSITKTFPLGTLQIELTTKTVEGCVSDPVIKTMEISSKPATSIHVQDACYGDPLSFEADNLTPEVPIHQWYWFTGDGSTDSSARPDHHYVSGGVYNVRVYALNNAGCSSDTVSAIATIYQTNAKTGNDTVVAFGQPLQLHASGGDFYQWMPTDGLNNPAIADPIATLYDNIKYILRATVAFGCPTYDTILIKAYKGPEIYVPNAFSPDNNGHNDRFHPVAVGIQTIDFFEIFNRAGQMVFSAQSIGEGWDGNFNGVPQPVGTYIWIIRSRDYLGITCSQKGTVVLFR